MEERESLLVELRDAKARIKELEDEKRLNYIKVIKKFGDKYSDEELQKEDLKTLEVIVDAISRFAPTEEKPDLLPMPDKVLTRKEVRAATEKRDRDLESVFADVNEEFNMTNLN